MFHQVCDFNIKFQSIVCNKHTHIYIYNGIHEHTLINFIPWRTNLDWFCQQVVHSAFSNSFRNLFYWGTSHCFLVPWSHHFFTPIFLSLTLSVPSFSEFPNNNSIIFLFLNSVPCFTFPKLLNLHYPSITCSEKIQTVLCGVVPCLLQIYILFYHLENLDLSPNFWEYYSLFL